MTGLILNITFKMAGLKFGDSLVIRQTAKLKSPPNKPRIRYMAVMHYVDVSSAIPCNQHPYCTATSLEGD